MEKDIILKLVANGAFNGVGCFTTEMNNPNYDIRVSIPPQNVEGECPDFNCCFFVYENTWLINSYFCEITGNTTELKDIKVNCYPLDCKDIRSPCYWEWVDIKKAA